MWVWVCEFLCACGGQRHQVSRSSTRHFIPLRQDLPKLGAVVFHLASQQAPAIILSLSLTAPELRVGLQLCSASLLCSEDLNQDFIASPFMTRVPAHFPFELGSCYLAQDGFSCLIPQCWNYSGAQTHLVCQNTFTQFKFFLIIQSLSTAELIKWVRKVLCLTTGTMSDTNTDL